MTGVAEASTTKLDIVWAGSNGTVVFIHGKGNCTMSSLGSFDSRCGNDPRGYWLNSTNDGGDGHDFMDEATAFNTGSSFTYSEAISLRYDGENQAFWYATNDVAACLSDLAAGTNSSGCNPSLIRRTQFRVVAHSEGGAIVDRILSTGWWPALTGAGGAIIGNPVTSSGALAGARSASALYGVDGASNFCTTLVSWIAGWALKSPGTASLTRGTVIGEANNGKAGKSPRWVYKVTTTGGSGSCNNNSSNSISESVDDGKLGALCGCIGYSTDDDADGILWMYDSDPTSNPGSSNGGKVRSQYTGYYWHWVASWANHSHTRNDAYIAKYGYQTSSGCYAISPGTCVGQYAR
ncbi:MAG: hypothetical protein JO257_00215 [Deltaproteobacteria bacterium]|nr:hypothetical protein [Deltaproteobacteria bacterium]